MDVSTASTTDSASAADSRVKICGFKRLEDALAAARAGADFLGYVFFPKSPRDIPPSEARLIVQEVRLQFPHVRHVGVMVNESPDSAERLVREADLDFAQLHGNESPPTVMALRARGVGVIKAFRFGPGAPPADWSEFEADYFLCDTYNPAAAGGTGEGFDHTLLPPDLPRERLFLAGGLSAVNVAAAISAVGPFAVDVSSGVEEAPGLKCHQRMVEFLRQAKGTGAAGAES